MILSFKDIKTKLCARHFLSTKAQLEVKATQPGRAFSTFRALLQMNCDAEKLVRCVEARPSIYDFNSLQYGNRAIVDKLWEEIAIEMNCSACKVKWAYLRNSYTRVVRDCSAASITGGKRKQWYLTDAMSFLRDFIRVGRPSAGSLEDCKKEYSHHFEGNDKEQDYYLPLGGLSHHDDDKTENLVLENHPDEFIYGNSHGIEEEDSSMTFFRSLIPDVNKLDERRRRKFKLEVFALLNRELEQQESEQT